MPRNPYDGINRNDPEGGGYEDDLRGVRNMDCHHLLPCSLTIRLLTSRSLHSPRFPSAHIPRDLTLRPSPAGRTCSQRGQPSGSAPVIHVEEGSAPLTVVLTLTLVLTSLCFLGAPRWAPDGLTRQSPETRPGPLPPLLPSGPLGSVRCIVIVRRAPVPCDRGSARKVSRDRPIPFLAPAISRRLGITRRAARNGLQCVTESRHEVVIHATGSTCPEPSSRLAHLT